MEKTAFIEWIQDLFIQYNLSTGGTLAPESVEAQVQDNIPEPWREAVSVQSIRVGHPHDNTYELLIMQNVIHQKQRQLSNGSDRINKPMKQSGASNARKWHEKFQRSRK